MDFGDARRAEGAPDPETGAGAGEPGAVHLHAQYFWGGCDRYIRHGISEQRKLEAKHGEKRCAIA